MTMKMKMMKDVDDIDRLQKQRLKKDNTLTTTTLCLAPARPALRLRHPIAQARPEITSCDDPELPPPRRRRAPQPPRRGWGLRVCCWRRTILGVGSRVQQSCSMHARWRCRIWPSVPSALVLCVLVGV